MIYTYDEAWTGWLDEVQSFLVVHFISCLELVLCIVYRYVCMCVCVWVRGVITTWVDTRGQTELITLSFHVQDRLTLSCTIMKWAWTFTQAHHFSPNFSQFLFSELVHCVFYVWQKSSWENTRGLKKKQQLICHGGPWGSSGMFSPSSHLLEIS